MLRALLAVVALLLVASASAAADDAPRVLVTLQQERADALRGDTGDYARRPHAYSASAQLAPELGALAREYGLRRVAGWPMRALGVHCEVFEAARDADLAALVARLAADPRVESAQPMQQFHTLGAAAADPYRNLQRGFDALELDAAHARTRGRGARVAVIDSGIDRAHGDLAGAVRARREFASGAPDPHGTEVAGVIAAREHNGVGIVGVAPEAELYDLRACWSDGPGAPAACDSYGLARALDFAIAAHVDVINLSLAGPEDALLARLLGAAEARGIAVVAAAPAAGSAATFPASLDSVIAVAMSESSSSAGRVRAPGADIFTTAPGNRYDYATGSSLASAHVAGVVALARAVDPRVSPAKLRGMLRAHEPLSARAVLDAM